MDDESKVTDARDKLIDYVTSLGLPVMTEEEFTQLAERARLLHSNYNEVSNV